MMISHYSWRVETEDMKLTSRLGRAGATVAILGMQRYRPSGKTVLPGRSKWSSGRERVGQLPDVDPRPPNANTGTRRVGELARPRELIEIHFGQRIFGPPDQS